MCPKCSEYIASDNCNDDNLEDFWLEEMDTSALRNKNCRKCGGLGKTTCTSCYGKNYESDKCSSCDGSGQVTFEEYDEILESNRRYEKRQKEAKIEEEEKNRILREEAEKREVDERPASISNSIGLLWQGPVYSIVMMAAFFPLYLIVGVIFALFGSEPMIEGIYKSICIFLMYIGGAVAAFGFLRLLYFACSGSKNYDITR